MTASIEVHGLRELLVELRKYDKTLYKQIADRLIATAQPVANKIGSAYPNMPLERWHSSGGRLETKSKMPPYNATAVKRGVKPIITTGRALGGKVGIMRMEQKNAGGAVYDAAGSRGGVGRAGAQFIKNLDKHSSKNSTSGRTRSRILFPLTKAYIPEIQAQVRIAIEETNTMIKQQIIKAA